MTVTEKMHTIDHRNSTTWIWVDRAAPERFIPTLMRHGVKFGTTMLALLVVASLLGVFADWWLFSDPIRGCRWPPYVEPKTIEYGFKGLPLSLWVLFSLPVLLCSSVLFWREKTLRHRRLDVDALGLIFSHLHTFAIGLTAAERGGYRMPDGIEDRVAFVDIEDLGFDEHALWLVQDDGQRTRVSIDALSAQDRRQLHASIVPRWQAMRSSLSEGEDGSRSRLARLLASTGMPGGR